MNAFKYDGVETGGCGESPSCQEDRENITDELIDNSTFLFEGFNVANQGGIMVAPDGQLFEVRHSSWASKGATPASRAQYLPYRVAKDGNYIVFDNASFNPAIQRGAEFEWSVTYMGQPYEVAPDGVNVVWPSGKSTSMKAIGADPEALKTMLEFSTGDPVSSTSDYRRKLVETVYEKDHLLEAKGLNHAGLALHPWAIRDENWSGLPYVSNVKGRMPNSNEFGVMSYQTTMEAMHPEAALYALNEYQIVAAAISFMTQAAPIRDGSLRTTVGEHYGVTGKEAENPDTPAYLPEGDYASLVSGQTPLDWRELSRVVGSPSAGTFVEAAPLDIREFLRRADRQLREGDIVTSGRTLGWHADRFREQGRIEICNIGTAGGNLNKVMAAHELVVNFFIAKQLEYREMSDDQRAEAAERHKQYMALGHMNNINLAFNGRETRMFTGDGDRTTSVTNVLQHMMDVSVQAAKRYRYEGLSKDATSELTAMISPDAELRRTKYTDATTWFRGFFKAGSHQTATEAIRFVHESQPELSVDQILAIYSEARREHTKEVATAYGIVVSREVQVVQ